MLRAVVLSYRLGMRDGVSVEAAKWVSALRRLGWQVTTAAGDGNADFIIPGFAKDALDPPTPSTIEQLFVGADLVIVENILSLPLNLAAARLLAAVLCGRPTLLHHHDMAWQRPAFQQITDFPLDDPAWRHVTINRATQSDLTRRGIASSVIPNTISFPVALGRREFARRRLDLKPADILVLQPTRAIPRKNIPAALRLATAIGGTYWLTGPAEDGYEQSFRHLIDTHDGPVRLGLPRQLSIADAYAAADVVAFPSLLEGFGNPVIESAVYRRPLAVGSYPVLEELREYGFRWFHHDNYEAIRAFLAAPDSELLEHNANIVCEEFSSTHLDRALAQEIAALDLVSPAPPAFDLGSALADQV